MRQAAPTCQATSWFSGVAGSWDTAASNSGRRTSLAQGRTTAGTQEYTLGTTTAIKPAQSPSQLPLRYCSRLRRDEVAYELGTIVADAAFKPLHRPNNALSTWTLSSRKYYHLPMAL